MQKKVKLQSLFTKNKTNKRFGGWSSEGMKQYDEISKVAKSNGELNQQVEYQFKDFMMRIIMEIRQIFTNYSGASIVRYT